jgi:hypothetical protein
VSLLLLAGLAAVVRAVTGALPALLVVVFAGLLALLGLACGPGRRDYALDYADRLIDLAAVLVGRDHPGQDRYVPRERRTLRLNGRPR